MKLERHVPRRKTKRGSFLLLLLVVPSSYGQSVSNVPSLAPIGTGAPTVPLPTLSPSSSHQPSLSVLPSPKPSRMPSDSSIPTETMAPTLPVPSLRPSSSDPPSLSPTTGRPTITGSPTEQPTVSPSLGPTHRPSQRPSISASPTGTVMPSCRPSHSPTESPTETQGPSPSPSAFPTAPSSKPSISLYPSRTSSPSNHPSSTPTTGAPSVSPSSPAPSASPSISPTLHPTETPTFLPTIFPSSIPTVTMVDESRLELRMTFSNFPILTNASKIEIWEEQTSLHIERYWNARPSPVIVVTQVSTFYLRQEERRRLDNSPVLPQTSFLYSQAIRFGYLREDTESIEANTDEVFTRAFVRDQQDYVDRLLSALELSLDPEAVAVEEIRVVDNNTLAPTQVPTIAPLPTYPTPGASSATVIVSSLMAVLVLTALLIAGYVIMIRRQRQNEIDWAAENNREFTGEDPDQNVDPDEAVRTGQIEGDLGAFAVDPNSFQYPDNDDANNNNNNHGNSRHDGYFHEERLASPLEPPPSPPANLLGNGDPDSDDDAELDPMSQPLADQTYPPEISHAASFESTGVDELPSLAGFNVTVMDIDDNVSL